ncbi:hypothetical protein KY329_04440 [Candidatus Woesearchaeota archaeon]|nr:hypothetical protein [Candidatus Woesearchaeota archaeon]
MHEQKLVDLTQKEFCDDETAGILRGVDHPFLSEVIDYVHQQVEPEDDEKYHLGTKLLFLESLFSEEEPVIAKVTEWLNDPKRKTLFLESNQGDFYGELLIAKATKTLDDFRLECNKGVEQQEYTSEKKLVLDYDPALKETSVLINAKIDTIFEQIAERIAEPVERAFAQAEKSDLKEDVELFMDYNDEHLSLTGIKDLMKERLGKVVTELCNRDTPFGDAIDAIAMLDDSMQYYLSPSDDNALPRDMSDWNEIVKRQRVHSDASISKDAIFSNWYEILKGQKIHETINELVDKCDPSDIYSAEKSLRMLLKVIHEEFRQWVQNVLQPYMYGLSERTKPGLQIGKLPEDYELAMFGTEFTPAEEAELETIWDELQRIAGFSDKLKRAKTIEYRLQISTKDPLDITFGNDAGCCIGIKEDSIGNGYGVPHMLADNSVYMIEVYQKINDRKEKRMGLVLAFDTVDELGRRILACNSLELSAAMSPNQHLTRITAFVEEELAQLAETWGYDAAIMSSHDYNTSQNFSHKTNTVLAKPILLKKTGRRTEFYSEIFDENMEAEATPNTFYVLYAKPNIICETV